MGLTVTKLDELDVTDVQANHDLNRQLVQEDNPQIRVQRGTFDDTTLYYGGVLATVNQEHLDRLKRSQSLLVISNEPTLADDDIVDGVLSNLLLTRKVGSAARGTITIAVSELASVTIANGAVFSALGQEFTADAAYVARTSSENLTGENDRILSLLPDGTYGFTIGVTASVDGPDSRLSKDDALIPSQPPLNFVRSYAASDFTGGVAGELNADLVARAAEGPAVKALSGRTAMQATLRSRTGFEDVLASSIIGMGDPEMLRDRHWIWPTSGGGKVDWYVRSQDQPQKLGLTKTATLVEKTVGNRGTWQFSLTRDEAPGFYDVYSIQLPSGDVSVGSFAVTSDTRGTDTSDDRWAPDIADPIESAYSPYQTATIRFADTETDTSSLTVGDTASYPVTLRIMPLLAEIQAEMGAHGTRNAAGDVLIKAPVPCFLQLSFTVQIGTGDETPDTEGIANALATAVNNYGFSGRLPASLLTETVQQLLPLNASLSKVDMYGKIRRPDGTIKALRSFELLTVPDEPDRLVSPRTVVFFLDPLDVGISIQTTDRPEV